MSNVITRFAPSPTGSLHIGGIRTALYAYALAKKSEGKFLLRIEDTDQTRFVEGTDQEIDDMLIAYGLGFDERFQQSERKEIYQEYANKLVKSNKAYYCFATKEELQEARELAQENGGIFRFRSPYRDLPPDEALERINAGEEYVIRLRTPLDREINFEDKLQGKMKFNTGEVDDTVLLKSDGLPTYHLAVVVDDHLMEVSHVLRGVEWIPSIPKHVLIYEAFGWEMPEFFHLPVILDPEGGKLSKRKGTVAAEDFLKQGYLPEAVLNFLMLIGWSPPLERKHGETEREIFSLEEFVQMFDTKDLNKSSGIFNREKLLWFNHQYIMNMPVGKLVKKYGEWHVKYGGDRDLRAKISEKGDDYLRSVLKLVQERLKLLSEIDEAIRIFYFGNEKADFSEYKHTKNVDTEDIKQILSVFALELEKKSDNLSDWSHEQWEGFMRKLAEEKGLGAGKVFMTLRLALTNSPATPPLYEILLILGKKETLTRLSKYVDNK